MTASGRSPLGGRLVFMHDGLGRRSVRLPFDVSWPEAACLLANAAYERADVAI